MTYALELIAVLAAGAYGILRARQKEMDFVGVFAVAFIVAFGGGTLRDLCLDRHPLFWIEHDEYPVILFTLALGTSFLPRLPDRLEHALNFPDALGLGLFAIVGANRALETGASPFVASLLGVVTGIFGGVMGDVVCNEVPRVFRPAPLYATCAFTGAWVFLLLRTVPGLGHFPQIAGVLVTVAFRMVAVRWSLRLPVHRHQSP
jgi:uncharacterized membrane protein YeiH